MITFIVLIVVFLIVLFFCLGVISKANENQKHKVYFQMAKKLYYRLLIFLVVLLLAGLLFDFFARTNWVGVLW